ncbi:polysialyltransferase family glycosyltransferase [uncultured Winogradskyella sp.]|uniref:polysialyltransferase family glycosyltransferase n=1 Tax=uncultured Winogradskyella sp. TaxID=395353 RepID=UPI00262465F8|nr:polysialyltransferase family glycosyltransferase [uncultured Winogradskyella sp.]
MKNLFYIHSHLTYYVTKAIIKKFHLVNEDIVFVISRNYENDEISNFTIIDITDIHDDLDSFGLTNFYKKHKQINKIDKLLTNQFRDGIKFRAYLPHVFHPAMQIIVTHNQCDELHIIEEGVNAYSLYLMNNNDKSIVKELVKSTLNALPFIGKKRIFFVKTFDLTRFAKKTPSIFYSITSKGFQGLPYHVERIKMLPSNHIDYDISGSSVLVLEGAVEQGNMKLSTMLNGIKRILEDVTAGKIYIKFHPAQSKTNCIKIENLIKQHNINTEVIPNNIAFEQIILTNSGLKVYGFTTSLLFYASEYGCEVFSYEDYLDNDLLFKTFREKNNFDLERLLNG